MDVSQVSTHKEHLEPSTAHSILFADTGLYFKHLSGQQIASHLTRT